MGRPRASTTVVVVVAAMVVAVPATAADPAAGRVLAGPCAECHGADGVGSDPEVPSLAGQREGYLAKQLWDFHAPHRPRSDPLWRLERRHPYMDRIGGNLADPAIEDLAAHFARLRCGATITADRVPRPAKAPRCDFCHGPEGRSTYDLIPHLAGQKRAYLARQMRLLHDASERLEARGAEGLRLHPMMNAQAHLLNDDEIAAFAAYYSNLPCR